MARTKLILMSFNTGKDYDLIILVPPLSLEENMSANSESCEEGKNLSVQSSSPSLYQMIIPTEA